MAKSINSTKPAKKLWPPIHEVTYTNGDTRWQVRYQLNGKRTNEVFQTKAEAVAAAAQIRLKIANEGAAGFNLPREVQVEAAAAVETLTPYEGKRLPRPSSFTSPIVFASVTPRLPARSSRSLLAGHSGSQSRCYTERIKSRAAG